MKLNKTIIIVALGFIAAACSFLQPDYLQMITASDLKEVMEKQDIFLVDVHTPEQSHIKGTDVFVPYGEIEIYKDKFPKDLSAPIYIYCEGGPMGNAAARSLYKLGYHNLYNLEGGANSWRQKGLAFE